MRLSKTQRQMILRLSTDGPERTPFTGGRNSGTVTSGWYRTVRSLEDKGLVGSVRHGDGRLAFLTDLGEELAESLWTQMGFNRPEGK